MRKLITIAVLLASAVIGSALSPPPKTSVGKRGATGAHTFLWGVRGGKAVSDEGEGDPNLMYPEGRFAWDKPAPKSSLVEIGQDKTAAPWILTLIEALHWFSFPLGFYVAWYIFKNASAVAAKLILHDNKFADERVFLIILGLLTQVFGGGVPVVMHLYEGWQVAPFRNPIALPANPNAEEGNTARLPNYNNAWLRSCAYQMLFTFQSFGLGCFTMAVFGINPKTIALIGFSMFFALVGPHKPRPSFYRKVSGKKRPFLPISWVLVIVTGLNIALNLWAAGVFFYPASRATLPGWKKVVLAILPSLLLGGGGAFEGVVGETSFNQWAHCVAFVLLLMGLGSYGFAFNNLVNPLEE